MATVKTINEMLMRGKFELDERMPPKDFERMFFQFLKANKVNFVGSYNFIKRKTFVDEKKEPMLKL